VQVGQVNIPADDPGKRRFYEGTYKGIRTILVPVRFNPPFKRTPRIVTSLQKIDLGDPAGHSINRLLVRAEEEDNTGFKLCFSTWEDSKVFDAAATWIAVGE
jgi:hypothetical protein